MNNAVSQRVPLKKKLHPIKSLLSSNWRMAEEFVVQERSDTLGILHTVFVTFEYK